jgi:hypothetical protein
LLTVDGGTGTISNSGTIRILAGAGVPADGAQYSPISAGTWSGSGKYQALGGVWDKTSHTFTASSVTAGASGSAVALDLKSVQRTLIDGNGSSGTGWQVGASLPAAATTTNMTFTATATTGTPVDTLKRLLPMNGAVMSGSTFATTGYTVNSTNPVYLSFNVGPAQLCDDLKVWQYSGSSWTPYAASDLTYDRKYASLTVSALGTYAVSGDFVLTGDANRDGSVTFEDLGALLSNLGSTSATWNQGDFSGDSSVTLEDLGSLLSHLGQTAPWLDGPASGNMSAVPEPGTLALLAAGVLGVRACMRRKRKQP